VQEARKRQAELETNERINSESEELDLLGLWLKEFFRKYALPPRDTVLPDDPDLHKLICAAFDAADISTDDYHNHPGRLTALLSRK
jgi:hypothetical protein